MSAKAPSVRDMTTNHTIAEQNTDDFAGRQLLNQHRPEQVLRPTSAAQVVEAVRSAADAGHQIAVQATGHGRARGISGGTLILTAELDHVRVDPERRTARIAAGVRWEAVIAAAARHGLAPLSGSAPSVGAIGLTLGGGFGLMSPRFGYAADHVRAIDLVTPDGRFRRVTAQSDPDLFWALRGAGAYFGVVTAIEIDLFPVEQVVGGTVSYDLAADPDVLHRWQDWCTEQPSHLLAAATVVAIPDLPTVPEPMRGRLIANLHLACTDTTMAIDEAADALRNLGRPLTDSITTLPYARSGEIFAEPDSPGGYRGSGWLLDRLPTAALTELPEQLHGQSTTSVIGIRRLGGAMVTPPAVPNAIGHRAAEWSLGVLSPVAAGDDPTSVRTKHDQLLWPWRPSMIGRALNFTFDELTPDQVGQCWDTGALPRLCALRSAIDPDRMMITNHRLPES